LRTLGSERCAASRRLSRQKKGEGDSYLQFRRDVERRFAEWIKKIACWGSCQFREMKSGKIRSLLVTFLLFFVAILQGEKGAMTFEGLSLAASWEGGTIRFSSVV